MGDEDRRLVFEELFKGAGELHGIQHIAIERTGLFESGLDIAVGHRAQLDRREGEARQHRLADPGELLQRRGIFRADVDGAQHHGVFGVGRGFSRPNEADHRDARAGAPQSGDDRSIGDLVARGESTVGHDRCGEQQMHLTYPVV